MRDLRVGNLIKSCTPVVKFPKLEEEWIPLRDACVGTHYSKEYLSLLARLGFIDATKRKMYWYTKRQAEKTYQNSL